MGFAISWIAVFGTSSQAVLDQMDLARTGKTEEFPEAPFSCADLPGGGFLIYANQFDWSGASARKLGKLSVGCKIVSCRVEEHVMASSASGYENGREVWHVEHDAEKGVYHLLVRGALPPSFDSIHATLKSKQDAEGGDDADVDFLHDVPVEVARAATGFRHDRAEKGSRVSAFEVLQQINPPGRDKPWWRFW